ncbi:MAG: methionyl-tRNA formyltransferase [Candidatus Dormibacteria bacterium]
MRAVFAGTAEFALPSLRALAEAHDVVAAVTQPERPGSRGRSAPRPVAEMAAELGIPLLQPERIRAPQSVAEILALRPDVLVVAAYGQIIPPALLDGPPLGGLNVHASLLPRWRGAAPVAAAILAGDSTTGVSIMQMDPGLDTGPVFDQAVTPIGPSETAPILLARLAGMGAELLMDVLGRLQRGEAVATPQDEAAATVAPRLRREDGAIAWENVSAVDLDRRLRALQPWPGVTAALGGQVVRLLAGTPLGGTGAPSRTPPGHLVAAGREHADVATAAGTFRISTVQPPGGRPMSAAAYLRGRRHVPTG